MKKKKDYTIVLLLALFLFACLCSCNFQSNAERHYKSDVSNITGHTCKWKLCPYEGIFPAQYKQAVIDYSECEEGSDCFCIDMLHLQYPAAEYDQLDSMLFTPIKK
jgi:hypothetical protein